jgi:hypothetical protein
MTGLAGVLALTLAGPSLASPLDQETCSKLREEHAQLVNTGAKANMERGPDWAKANLPRDKINQIERLLVVEEQLAFRCPQPKPPLERAENPQPAAAPGAAPSGSDQPKGASPPKLIRAQPKARTPSATRDANQDEPRRPKKIPPRPKVDDAYVPPPKASAAPPGQAPMQ